MAGSPKIQSTKDGISHKTTKIMKIYSFNIRVLLFNNPFGAAPRLAPGAVSPLPTLAMPLLQTGNTSITVYCNLQQDASQDSTYQIVRLVQIRPAVLYVQLTLPLLQAVALIVQVIINTYFYYLFIFLSHILIIVAFK